MSNPIAQVASNQARRLVRREAAVAGKAVAAEAGARSARALAPDVLSRISRTVTVDEAAFRRAVAKLENKVAADKALQAAGNPAELHLQPHMEMIFKPQATAQAKGTVVMFHGFTAGPWQYGEMAKVFHDEGYHVVAPRLPGHGLMKPDGRITGEMVPGTAQREVYSRFLDEVFTDAAALGAPVHAVGLSGGGNMALKMAERHPEVKRVVAMAPFLGPDGGGGLMYKVVGALDKLTFGGAGRLLDRIGRGKNGLASVAELMPHTQPSYGAAVAMQQQGASVKRVEGAVQFISTQPDAHSGIKPVRKLFERSGGAEKNGWYHFAKGEGVPHAMLAREQNPVPGAVDKLHEIALKFIEEGRATNRLPGR